MVGHTNMDNMFEDLFDNIDDFLNFPCEDVEGDIIGCGVGGDSVDGSECNRLKDVWHCPQETFSGSGSDSLGGDISSELPTELLVPYEDIAHLEWLSTFVEDSFSIGNIAIDEDESLNINKDKEHSDMNKENNESHHFQTHSPVSVLDSSSSSSSCSEIKTMPINPEMVVPGRARSKRPRPATFKPRPVFPPPMPPSYCISDPTPPFQSSQFSSSLDDLAESETTLKIPNLLPTEPKKKKIKVKFSPMPGSMEQYTSPQTVAVRKCLHCQITKTPQWRMGPLGPKTLCNACGVRYKSGRLFPEYRPAASPTFVPTLHSNSHRKVLEMRTRGDLNMAETWSDDCGSLITYEGRGILPF